MVIKNNLLQVRKYFEKGRRVIFQDPRIFCIGLHKTGTTTLHQCLMDLGYQSIHYPLDRHLQNSEIIDFIKKSSYRAFSDWPICRPLFFKQLDNAFPGSKFILTTRKTPLIWGQSAWKFLKKTEYRNEYLPGPALDEQIRKYEDHNDSARQYFLGRDDFLELCFEDGDGWQKLCDFLKKPVPAKTFPHLRPQYA